MNIARHVTTTRPVVRFLIVIGILLSLNLPVTLLDTFLNRLVGCVLLNLMTTALLFRMLHGQQLTCQESTIAKERLSNSEDMVTSLPEISHPQSSDWVNPTMTQLSGGVIPQAAQGSPFQSTGTTSTLCTRGLELEAEDGDTGQPYPLKGNVVVV